jgi:hypothetical protein
MCVSVCVCVRVCVCTHIYIYIHTYTSYIQLLKQVTAIAYAGGTRDFGAVQEFQQRTCELQMVNLIQLPVEELRCLYSLLLYFTSKVLCEFQQRTCELQMVTLMQLPVEELRCFTTVLYYCTLLLYFGSTSSSCLCVQIYYAHTRMRRRMHVMCHMRRRMPVRTDILHTHSYTYTIHILTRIQLPVEALRRFFINI